MKKATLVVAIALVSLFALGSTACGTDEAAIKAEAAAEAKAAEAEKAEKRQEAAEARQEAAEETARDARIEDANRAVELTQEGTELSSDVQSIAQGAVDRFLANDMNACDVIPELESKLDRLDTIVAELRTLDTGADVDENMAALTSSLTTMRDGLGQTKGACASVGY